jgi:hypothetical protein
MKWLFIILPILIAGLAGFIWVKDRPQFYYQEILSGKDPIPSYFKGGKVVEQFLRASPYPLERSKVIYQEQEKYWKSFHLSHFEVEVPYDHPLFYPVPVVEPTNFAPHLGLSFYDSLGKFIFSFTALTPFPLRYFNLKDKIFNFPATENYLNNLDRKKIWEDLFLLNIPKVCQSCSLYELVYHLYILRLREEYLTSSFENIYYFKEKNIGILTSFNANSNFDEEILYYHSEGIIYPMRFRIQKNNPQAEVTRQRIVKSLTLKSSQVDSRVSIFAEYQNLSPNEQRSIKSVYFLFSAWTHDQENENYFQLLIRNLESYKPQDQTYHPLYEYSYKKFGSTFSRYGDSFKETMDRKLKRKIEEELQAEIDKSRRIESKAPIENFKSESEKQDYYLKESNEKQITDEKDELTID